MPPLHPFTPDFKLLLNVLKREKPERPVLFEYFVHAELIEFVTGKKLDSDHNNEDKIRTIIEFFFNAGYDYATIPARYLNSFFFDTANHDKKVTLSLNSGSIIHDFDSFGSYSWPNPDNVDYRLLDTCANDLKDGMKFIVPGPGGLLENVIYLTGFENLCFMVLENEELCLKIFEAVGSRLLKFYENIISIQSVGAIIVNDDWGFKNQTLFSPETLRQFVFPWQRKIVEFAHQNGKPAILHSCGHVFEVFEDIIMDMQFDGKHSFEDNILPVEEVYKQWGNRISILGGIDVDFLCRSGPLEISKRCKAMLKLTDSKGYALGSGNSIPNYVPIENYLAMIRSISDI